MFLQLLLSCGSVWGKNGDVIVCNESAHGQEMDDSGLFGFANQI